MEKRSPKKAGRKARVLQRAASPTPRSSAEVRELPLHQRISEQLLGEIERRVFLPGDRLPSEAMLCERFGASRITVSHAIQTLQRAGLVTRRSGSGTFVQAPAQAAALHFGLIIPGLGSTEIFEPICRGMAQATQGRAHTLSWGGLLESSNATVEAAERLCQQYIAQRVAGVFFAPIEQMPDNLAVNRRIAAALAAARMPTVLLDRRISPSPEQDAFDCVGIDHYAAGFTLTRHLLEQGARRIVFIARPYSAFSIDERFAGCCRALQQLGKHYRAATEGVLHLVEPGDMAQMRAALAESRPDALLCANDITAAGVMQMLPSLGVRVPEDVRLVGIDDVRYAQFLPVPLTTLRQNCAEIGAVAMATMLDRIARPERPTRNVHIAAELIVRASCGAALRKQSPAGARKRPS